MKVEQIYTGCLAHGAYYIESNGEAAVIDPLRDVVPYLEMANARNAKIKYIFETHFHADFVSGHVDLARLTGAEIVYGPTTLSTGFKATIATDGQVFHLGNITLKLLHTPGHTMESSCYLLHDESGKPVSIFSGDTLFIGDVGRPDLAQHVIADLTEDKLASHLYHSLRSKIMTLPDELIVYPGHGAGSACGKNLSKETSDLLGNQKKNNYALNPLLSEEEFKKELLTGLTAPPSYFPKNVLMNITGYDQVEEVVKRGTTSLSIDQFRQVISASDVVVIDTRRAADFANGFIPGSINIGIDGSFAVWVGTVIKDINQKIALVSEPGREEEIAIRLARVGYDHAVGYLDGGFDAWKHAGYEVDKIQMVNPEELKFAKENDAAFKLIDVRKKSEFDAEHFVGAENHPLDYFEKAIGKLDHNQKAYIHCAGGYRSMLFNSLLRARGYKNLIDAGGFNSLKASGYFEATNYVCQSTML